MEKKTKVITLPKELLDEAEELGVDVEEATASFLKKIRKSAS